MSLTLFFLVLVAGFPAEARDGRSGFGLGVILGEPTGLSMKTWTGASTAFQGAVAWSFSNETNLHLHLDHVWHRWDLIDVEEGVMPFYFGVGGRLKLRDETDDELGIRIPVGLAYYWTDVPLDLFVELVPILDLAPDTELDVNAALGLRYFF
jgi:hypothetical protein